MFFKGNIHLSTKINMRLSKVLMRTGKEKMGAQAENLKYETNINFKKSKETAKDITINIQTSFSRTNYEEY